MSDETTTTEEVLTPAPPKERKKRVRTAPAKTAKVKAKAKGNGKAVKATRYFQGKANAKTKAKPRNIDPAKLDQFGFRLGSLKSQAATMYAGKKGATLAEVKTALDSTQFNLLTELEEKGYKVERTEVPGNNNRKVTCFKIIAK